MLHKTHGCYDSFLCCFVTESIEPCLLFEDLSFFVGPFNDFCFRLFLRLRARPAEETRIYQESRKQAIIFGLSRELAKQSDNREKIKSFVMRFCQTSEIVPGENGAKINLKSASPASLANKFRQFIRRGAGFFADLLIIFEPQRPPGLGQQCCGTRFEKCRRLDAPKIPFL